MSALIIYDETTAGRALLRTQLFDEIVSVLSDVGVSFERWRCEHPLDERASSDDILSAYRVDIARLQHERGYRSADVVHVRRHSFGPDDTLRLSALREKFLAEHRHSEDEVRLFVAGAGMFYLRAAGRVHLVLCERGDLLSVPAGMRHWFDMGRSPSFTTIRIFGTPDGWVADFTGDPIANRFPSYDEVAPQCR